LTRFFPVILRFLAQNKKFHNQIIKFSCFWVVFHHFFGKYSKVMLISGFLFQLILLIIEFFYMFMSVCLGPSKSNFINWLIQLSGGHCSGVARNLSWGVQLDNFALKALIILKFFLSQYHSVKQVVWYKHLRQSMESNSNVIGYFNRIFLLKFYLNKERKMKEIQRKWDK
jgi:hypothetical protein